MNYDESGPRRQDCNAERPNVRELGITLLFWISKLFLQSISISNRAENQLQAELTVTAPTGFGRAF